jgi:hypothetical protein
VIDDDYLKRLWLVEAARRELHESVIDRPLRNSVSDSHIYEALRSLNEARDALYAEAA